MMHHWIYILACTFTFLCAHGVYGQQYYVLSVPDGETTYDCGVYLDVVLRDGNRNIQLPIDDDLVILNKGKNVYLTVYLYGIDWDARLAGNAKGYINRRSFEPATGLDLRMSDAGKDIGLSDGRGGTKIPITFEVVSKTASGRLIIPLSLESPRFSDKTVRRLVGLDYMITDKADVAQWQTIRRSEDPVRFRQFIAAFPDSEHAPLALSHLRNLDLETWNSAHKQSPDAMRRYLTHFPEGEYAAEARAILAAVNSPAESPALPQSVAPEEEAEPIPHGKPRIPDDERRWTAIRTLHNRDSLLSFITAYPRSVYVEAAQRAFDNLIEESDAQLSYQVTMDGEWFVIRLINAYAPVIDFDYLDYVTRTNAVWDTSHLADEHVCLVRFESEGEYEVIFSDKWQQPLYVTLANILQASCTMAEGDHYLISIMGGKPPFRVLLREANTNATRFTKDQCQTRSVVIEMRELLKNRLKGEYNVIVKDRTSATVALKCALSVTPRFRIHPVVWLIALGLLLFGAWRYVMRRVKSPKTIFDSQ